MKNIKSLLALGSFALVAVMMHGMQLHNKQMMKDGFRADGIAGLDRIVQDETQKFCSDPVFANSKQGEKMRDKIQKQLPIPGIVLIIPRHITHAAICRGLLTLSS